MKLVPLLAFAALVLAGPQAFANAGDIHEKVVPINDVYIPSSFDAGTEPYVVVQGMFMNTCYSLKRVDVKAIDSLTQEISTVANVKEGMCFGDITPFHKEVPLGRLSTGDHVIRFLHGDGTFMEKHLKID